VTIDKAIELLNDIIRSGTEPGYPIFDNAIKLGIEALKQIKWLHESHVLHDDELLPGETKE